MHHDFASKHGGNNSPGSGSPCDGEGLMSYGSCKPSCRDSQMPDRWSSCSVRDFEQTFRDSTHRCLAEGQGDGPPQDNGCTCNGHTQRGYGECQQTARCGALSTIQTLAPTRTGATSDLPTAGLVRRARLV